MLLNLQCHKRESREKQRYDKETHHNLRLEESLLLVVVVDWRHQEYASSLTILTLCVFEIGGLDDHRQSLNKEDTTQ